MAHTPIDRSREDIGEVHAVIEPEVPPEARPQSKHLWLKLLDFLEHPLLLWAAGVVAAMVGYFIYPILGVCGICVLLAFHRAKVVSDIRLPWQVMSYVVLLVATTTGFMGIGMLVKKHIPQLATVSDIQELLRQAPNAQQSNKPIPAPQSPIEKPRPATLPAKPSLSKTAQDNPPQIIIQQIMPSFGNFEERTEILSHDIMNELCTHGWRPGLSDLECPPSLVRQPFPTTSEAKQYWTNRESDYFLFAFADKALAIKNEFAEHGFKDETLDRHLHEVQTVKDSLRDGKRGGPLLFPSVIAGIAQRLHLLAEQINRPPMRR